MAGLRKVVDRILMSTRRDFLLGCSAFAASASLVPLSVMGAVPRAVDLDAISLSSWEDQINTEFVLEEGACAGRRLVLEAVERSPGSQQYVTVEAGSARRQCVESFSLLFRVLGSGEDLPQNTYTFRHARLGTLQVFIVPMGEKPRSGRLHEAVFSRIVRPGTIAQGNHAAIDPVIG